MDAGSVLTHAQMGWAHAQTAQAHAEHVTGTCGHMHVSCTRVLHMHITHVKCTSTGASTVTGPGWPWPHSTGPG
jgi:hypothetical protein